MLFSVLYSFNRIYIIYAYFTLIAYRIIDPKPHFETLNDIYIHCRCLTAFLNGCFLSCTGTLQRIVEFNVIKTKKNKIKK